MAFAPRMNKAAQNICFMKSSVITFELVMFLLSLNEFRKKFEKKFLAESLVRAAS